MKLVNNQPSIRGIESDKHEIEYGWELCYAYIKAKDIHEVCEHIRMVLKGLSEATDEQLNEYVSIWEVI